MKRPRVEGEGGAPPPPPAAAGGLTVLHRVRAGARFAPWAVAAVTCVSACPDGSVFAAGYDDGKVELFDAALFDCLARIPGADGVEVSSLAWARAPGEAAWRLFAASLDGGIAELSPRRLAPLAAADSSGGPVWCLRAAPAAPDGGVTRLAAACGDGSVKLFAVAAHAAGAEYERALPRVEGNALSLAWHPGGASLVSGGSDGCIHCWDVARGVELQRITVGTSSTAPPCVWSLAVLGDGTIVSGDGDGAVQFWDGTHGTLLGRQQQFGADVLAVAASPDGTRVWASGVDPRVAVFQLVPDKATGTSAWAYLDRKAPHTHDVRALAVLPRPGGAEGGLLISGGNDGALVLYDCERFLKQHPTRQSKTPQRPLLALAPPRGGAPAALLHAAGRRLSVWQLGRAATAQPLASDGGAPPLEGEGWDLAALPSQLADISLAGPHHVAAVALAPDAGAVAAADRSRLRLFRLSPADPGAAAAGVAPCEHAGALRVERVKVDADLGAPVVCVAFSADGQHLFAATGAGRVVALDATSGELTASAQLPAPAGGGGGGRDAAAPAAPEQGGGGGAPWCDALAPFMPAVGCIAVAPSGQLVGEPSPVTALAFSPNSRFVAVATAANAVCGYSAETGLPTAWTLKHHAGVAELLQALPGSITGLAFRPTPAEPLAMLVHSPGGLCHLDMAAPPTLTRPDKAPRKAPPGGAPRAESFSERGRNGRLLKLQHCCLLLGHIGPGEALLLEKPWAEVLGQLLPPLYRHRYGT
ncbi:UTP4 [Scenedesmus sp. PABB004]|nr:UTP4 [Scenedesmus sp. PABB004]